MRMKFIVSLVLLAGSTLLARCDSILKCDADTTTLEVRIAAGQKLEDALVSSPDWAWKKYPNNLCKRWHIKAEENQCVEINTGDTYFLVAWEEDKVHFRDMGSLKYTYMTGWYWRKNIHAFTSETNNVVVEFKTDDKNNAIGFKLDLKSFPCLQGTITETYNGSEYTLIAKMQNYETSRQACMDLGGDLAIITSKQEHEFIYHMFWKARESISATIMQNIWIGLYQKTMNNADLQWVDGTPFMIKDRSWKPWKLHEPNNNGWTSVYLEPQNALFASKDPSLKYWALCEKSVD